MIFPVTIKEITGIASINCTRLCAPPYGRSKPMDRYDRPVSKLISSRWGSIWKRRGSSNFLQQSGNEALLARRGAPAPEMGYYRSGRYRERHCIVVQYPFQICDLLRTVDLSLCNKNAMVQFFKDYMTGILDSVERMLQHSRVGDVGLVSLLSGIWSWIWRA